MGFPIEDPDRCSRLLEDESVVGFPIDDPDRCSRFLEDESVVGFLRDDPDRCSRLLEEESVVGLVIDGLGSELRTPIRFPIPREPAIAELVGRLKGEPEDTLELGDRPGVRILLLAIALEPLRLWTETFRLMLGLEIRDDRLDENPRLIPGRRDPTELLIRDDALLVEGRLIVGPRVIELLGRDDTLLLVEGRLTLGLRLAERLDTLERLDDTGALEALDGRLAEGLLRCGLLAGVLRELEGAGLLGPPRPFAPKTGVSSSAREIRAMMIFLENSTVNMVCLLSIQTQSDNSILLI